MSCPNDPEHEHARDFEKPPAEEPAWRDIPDEKKRELERRLREQPQPSEVTPAVVPEREREPVPA